MAKRMQLKTYCRAAAALSSARIAIEMIPHRSSSLKSRLLVRSAEGCAAAWVQHSISLRLYRDRLQPLSQGSWSEKGCHWNKLQIPAETWCWSEGLDEHLYWYWSLEIIVDGFKDEVESANCQNDVLRKDQEDFQKAWYSLTSCLLFKLVLLSSCYTILYACCLLAICKWHVMCQLQLEIKICWRWEHCIRQPGWCM